MCSIDQIVKFLSNFLFSLIFLLCWNFSWTFLFSFFFAIDFRLFLGFYVIYVFSFIHFMAQFHSKQFTGKMHWGKKIKWKTIWINAANARKRKLLFCCFTNTTMKIARHNESPIKKRTNEREKRRQKNLQEERVVVATLQSHQIDSWFVVCLFWWIFIQHSVLMIWLWKNH